MKRKKGSNCNTGWNRTQSGAIRCGVESAPDVSCAAAEMCGKLKEDDFWMGSRHSKVF